ncbi:hypothetical protein Tco_0208850, partial [Tanacetum coccineum]
MLPSPTAVTVAVRIVPLHTMYPAVAWVALQTEIRISVLLQRQTKSQFGRQGSRSLARLRDEMRQSSGTQEYPSLIDTFYVV